MSEQPTSNPRNESRCQHWPTFQQLPDNRLHLLETCPQCEIERLRAALERIKSKDRTGYSRYALGRIAREALRGADETAAPLTGVDFLHAWMRTENPMLGGVTPLAMLKAGRGEKLAKFIEQAAAENGSAAPFKAD